jgi:hypothetical protein
MQSHNSQMSEDLVQTILQLAYKVHIHFMQYILVHIFSNKDFLTETDFAHIHAKTALTEKKLALQKKSQSSRMGNCWVNDETVLLHNGGS